MFSKDKIERVDVIEARLNDMEERLKNIETGQLALEEQNSFPGTLFQLEKAVRETSSILNWPVENELNADNFKNNLLLSLEAIGRSLLALNKRLEIIESIVAHSNQVSFRLDIVTKASNEFQNILQDTLPNLFSLINESDLENRQQLMNNINRLTLRLSLLDNAIQCSLLDYKLFSQLKTGFYIQLKNIASGEEFQILLAVGTKKDSIPIELKTSSDLLKKLSTAKEGDKLLLPTVNGTAEYEVIKISP